MDNTHEKIEKFQGLTFINTYEKEKDEVVINRFKRDMLKILNSTEAKEGGAVSA